MRLQSFGGIAGERVLLFALSVLCSPLAATAQSRSVATSNLNLRTGPGVDRQRIGLVVQGDTVELLPTPERKNYRRVVTAGRDTGWVWAVRLRVIDTDGADIAAPLTALSTASTGGADFSSWPRPSPQEVQGATCPAVGRGSTRVDSTTNLLKNRVDIPAAYHSVNVSQILGLPDTGLPTRRYHWTVQDSALVAKYEGVPLEVEGYLADAVEEGPEATNCGQDTHPWHDWHIWLVETEQEAISHAKARAVVVEVTPRVRALPMAWSLPDLKAIHNAHERVRVGGWLMFDPDHPANIGTSRGTIWEIHPVTHFEVLRNGAWVNLDQ